MQQPDAPWSPCCYSAASREGAPQSAEAIAEPMASLGGPHTLLVWLLLLQPWLTEASEDGSATSLPPTAPPLSKGRSIPPKAGLWVLHPFLCPRVGITAKPRCTTHFCPQAAPWLCRTGFGDPKCCDQMGPMLLASPWPGDAKEIHGSPTPNLGPPLLADVGSACVRN